MHWIGIILLAMLIVLIAVMTYWTLYFQFDEAEFVRRNDATLEKLRNNNIQTLLNGSGVNNIPGLEIVTPSAAISTANACASGPVFLGPGTTGTDDDCVRMCANSSAKILHIEVGDDTYRYEATVLRPGMHCLIGPRPLCNPATSFALMTINSITCRARFPQLVGGPTGTTVIACNDQLIQDPQNVLWDYKENRKFDPFRTTVLDEDEVLPSGEFRLRCRFGGFDSRKNQYIAHPKNRFHPVENPCTKELYAAHPDVRAIFADDGSLTCDCGNYETTRVFNFDPNDRSSPCTFVRYDFGIDIRNRYWMDVPYPCITLFSIIDDVGRSFVCPDDQFTRDGSRWNKIRVLYSHHQHEAIEHELYGKFPAGGSVRVVPKDTV